MPRASLLPHSLIWVGTCVVALERKAGRRWLVVAMEIKNLGGSFMYMYRLLPMTSTESGIDLWLHFNSKLDIHIFNINIDNEGRYIKIEWNI